MSWRDRPYSGDTPESELRIQFRRPSSIVTWLIVANVAVFILDTILQNGRFFLIDHLGLSLNGIKSFYIWQPISYMFMHSSAWHLFANMLGLYIFGTEFERHFGRQRFLEFYGICGVVGGLAYLALGAIKTSYATIPLVGASGAVYGLLIAAIIFFPHIQVVLIIFPMPIRVFGLIIAAILFLQLISPGRMDNPGGQLCHIAGAATGLGMLYAWRVMPSIRLGSGFSGARRRSRAEGAWARKQRQIAEEQEEVDRILEKVSHHGLQSLTWSEKRTLSRATQHQKERDRELHDSFRH